MKGFRKSPLFWLVLISTIAISIFAWWQKSEGFTGGSYDWKKEPILTIVMRKMQDLDQEVAASVNMDENEVTTLSGNLLAETVSENGFESKEEDSKSSAQMPKTVSENQAKKAVQFQRVEESYLDDALFIGDSRTVGLSEYSGLKNPTFYAKTSLTIYDFFDNKFISIDGEKDKITLEEALMLKSYGKIYVMLGINEMGRGTQQSFGAEYLKVLTRIRELQPKAILFVEGIMRVTASKSESDPIYNNNNINIRNALLQTVDNHKDVFYIDMNEAVCDENGNLNAEYTNDDIHLKASYYSLWKEFLLQHGIQ